MASSNLVKTTLTIKRDKKTFFKSAHINPSASDADLYSLAEAINSLQTQSLDKVTKTLEYRMTQ